LTFLIVLMFLLEIQIIDEHVERTRVNSTFFFFYVCHKFVVQKLAGREKELQVKKNADVVYKHVEGEVERGLEYLQVLPLDIVDHVWFVILYTFGKIWHLQTCI
jgi:hypothetical protein